MERAVSMFSPFLSRWNVKEYKFYEKNMVGRDNT